MKYHKFKKIEAAAKSHKLAGFKLTAKQLANISGKDGITGLHLAAHHGCLDQIIGGATAKQLEDCLTDHRYSALYLAVAAGHLPQIKRGVKAEDLADTKQCADIAFGFVMGTAEELADMDDEEYTARIQDTAEKCHSRNITQKTGLHWAAAYGQLNLVVGGVTFEQLNGLKDPAGHSPVDVAACHGHLDQIFGGITADQLASIVNSEGVTSLHWAAKFGHLDQIMGGATFDLLASVRDQDGSTPLHYAAYFRSLDQIKGGVTAEQLASVRKHDGYTALHTATSYVHVCGGATAEQLINTVADNGASALLNAAASASLAQIKNGVTAEQLASVATQDGSQTTALHYAASFCALNQIRGGASIQQLHSVRDLNGDTPLNIALTTRQLFELMEPDPQAYWQALPPAEQEILRQAVAGRAIPNTIANIIGSGIPVPSIDTKPDGTVTLLNFIADNQVFDTLPSTRSLNKLELNLPASSTLTCQHCQKSSRMVIPDATSHRHPCPQCGAIHYFSPALYELEATRRIKSLRQIWPVHCEIDCSCGNSYETSITHRNQKSVCPHCADEHDHQFPEWETHLVEQLKQVYSTGVYPGGWSTTPIDIAQVHKLASARTVGPTTVSVTINNPDNTPANLAASIQ